MTAVAPVRTAVEGAAVQARPAARRWRRPLARTLLALALVGAAGALLYDRVVAPLPARTFVVRATDVRHEVFGRGTLESRREVELGFDLVGRVSDVLVDEGDQVRLGEVLAHLAPEQLSAEAKTAASAVSVARAALSRLDAEERRASTALAFAQIEEARARALAAAGTLSRRDLDIAVQQIELARAEVDRVRAARAEGSRQIAVASGTVEIRSVTAARAVLVSPFEGVVTRRLRDPGDTVTIGTTVLRVVATDALWARAWIHEGALPSLEEGQPARVRLGTEGEPTLSGTVDRIGREVDRGTHELLVDVLLVDAPDRVAIGQRADVWIELDRRSGVVAIPNALVQRDGGGAFCFVDRDGRVERAPIVIGLEGSWMVEITAHLSAGDVVLGAAPGTRLTSGRRWRPEGT